MGKETLLVTDSRIHAVKVAAAAPVAWSMGVNNGLTIELSVYFRTADPKASPQEVPVVNVLHCETASHEWTAPADGELVFLFDNSFSWFNDKVRGPWLRRPRPAAPCCAATADALRPRSQEVTLATGIGDPLLGYASKRASHPTHTSSVGVIFHCRAALKT